MAYHLTHSKTQSLFLKSLQDSVWFERLSSPTTNYISFHFTPSLHCGHTSLLPALGTCRLTFTSEPLHLVFFPPRHQRGVYPYSEYLLKSHSPWKTLPDHPAKISSPNPHHSLSPHPALFFLIALMTWMSSVMSQEQGLCVPASGTWPDLVRYSINISWRNKSIYGICCPN